MNAHENRRKHHAKQAANAEKGYSMMERTNKRESQSSGMSAAAIAARREYRARWREKNRERIREYDRQYWDARIEQAETAQAAAEAARHE